MPSYLKTLNVSADTLRKGGMPESFVTDYMNFHKNMQILSTQVQLIKDGNQATNGVYAPLVGWTTERNVSQGIGISSASGEVTVENTGDYVVDAMAIGDAATGLALQLQKHTGGVWSDIAGAVSMNPRQCVINGALVYLSRSDKLRLMVKDTGGALNIGTGMARLTVGRKS